MTIDPALLLAGAKVAYKTKDWAIITRELVDKHGLRSIEVNEIRAPIEKPWSRYAPFDPINNDSDFKALWVGLNKLGLNVYYSLLFQGWKINIENDVDYETNTIDWLRIKEIKEPTPELAALKCAGVVKDA